MRTVLFVGAGRHQRRAILRAKQLGLRVVAVDRNADAVGLPHADEAHPQRGAVSGACGSASGSSRSSA